IDEEYRVEYIVDRLDTTSTVWMGLTMGCARCHDHKYDPISQKEFYQLFAFFNNTPETGNTRTAGNAQPVLQIPSPDYKDKELKLQNELQTLEQQHQQNETELARLQTEWEQQIAATLKSPPTEKLILHDPLDDLNQNQTFKAIGNVENNAGFLGTGAQFDGTALLES
ncbi:MAG: DUF1549 domain-containing protein, partial [Gimesia chilikensis]